MNGWLCKALAKGACGRWEGSFPRYVWYKKESVVYEARLVNSEAGDYKGYPLNEDEWPPNLSTIYE